MFDFGAVEELRGDLVLFPEPRTGRCVASRVPFEARRDGSMRDPSPATPVPPA
jgi:hypothetical protein